MENERPSIVSATKKENIKDFLSETRRSPAESYRSAVRDSDTRSTYRNRSYSPRGRSGRLTGRNLNRHTKGKKTSGVYDRLQTQIMAAALVLVAVLGVKFIDTGFTNKIETALSFVLTKSYSWNDIKDKGADTVTMVSALTDSVKTIFGFEKQVREPEKETETQNVQEKESEDAGLPAAADITLPELIKDADDERFDDFRIDEDILSNIQSQEDTYLIENAEKNELTPESPADSIPE